MASVKFEIRGKKNPATIFLRFRDSGISIYRKTGKVINPIDWNHDKKMPYGRSPQLKNLSKNLRDLGNFIVDAYNETNFNEINPEWVQEQVDRFNGVYAEEDQQSDLLIDAIHYMIDNANSRENSKGGLGLSASRINSYKTLLKLLKEYQGKKKFKVQDVDIKFGKSFVTWMLDKRNYAESYAKKKIDDLKTVCLEAEINGVKVSSQLKRVKGGKSKTDYILYLSPEELNSVKKTDIGGEALERAEKWLLLGCNIGQRGSDLLALKESKLVTRHGLDLIELKQQKTGKDVTIPVLETTKEILREGLPHPISIQKFNNYLKIICKEAGIDEIIPGSKIVMVDKEGKELPKDEKGKYIGKGVKRKLAGNYPKYELVSSHVCRRSFATNLYGKLPTPLIMQITAHGTEKMFLKYIGKSSMDYAQAIANFYSVQSSEENREKSLRVIRNASNSN